MDADTAACCPLVTRVLFVASSAVVLTNSVMPILPPWLETTLEVFLLSLALWNIHQLRQNLQVRAFTILVMALETVEALLSLLLLFPSPDVNPGVLAWIVACTSVVDMTAAVYYELRAAALVAIVATNTCDHPLYYVLSRYIIQFLVILGTLLRVVIPLCLVDLFTFGLEGGEAIAVLFFFVGLVQAGVAALGFGTAMCCWLSRLRPTAGKVCCFVPVAFVGAAIEMSLLGLVFLDAVAYLVVATLWSSLLCFVVVRVLETSITFDAFQVDCAPATEAAIDDKIVVIEEAMHVTPPSVVEGSPVEPSAPPEEAHVRSTSGFVVQRVTLGPADAV